MALFDAFEVEVEVEVDPFYCIIGCITAIKVATIKNKVFFLTLDLSLFEQNTYLGGPVAAYKKSTFISLRERVIL